MPGAGSQYGTDQYANAMRLMAMGDILKGGNGGAYYSYMQQMDAAKRADAQRAMAAAEAEEAEAAQRAMMEQAQSGLADIIRSGMPNPVRPFDRQSGDDVAAAAMAFVKPEMFPGLSQGMIGDAARTGDFGAQNLINMLYRAPGDMGERIRADYDDGSATFQYNDREAQEWARQNAPQFSYGFEGAGPEAKFEAKQSMPTPMAPERVAQIMMNPMVPAEYKQQLMARFQQQEPELKWIDGHGFVDMNDIPDEMMAGNMQAGPEDREMREDQNGLLRYVDTGEPVFPNVGQVAAGPDFDTEQDLRKEFRALPAVKAFSDVDDAWGRIQASAQDPSPAGDLALIFNYMKVLDPGSVVRESEFATAESAAQWLQEAGSSGIDVPLPVAAAIRRMATGERLSDDQRGDFVNRAGLLYNSQAQRANEEVEYYRGLADQYGLEPDRIAQVAELYNIPPERAAQVAAGRPDAVPAPPAAAQPEGPYPITDEAPPAPAGIAPDEWETAWANMTPEERAEALKIMRGGR